MWASLERVRAIRLSNFSFTDGLFQPVVVGLARELQDPARHLDGDTAIGELFHERVHHFPGRWAWDRYAVARRRTSTSCSRSRLRLRSSLISALSSVVTPGSRLLATQTTSLRNSLGEHFGHGDILPDWVVTSHVECHQLLQQTRDSRVTSRRFSRTHEQQALIRARFMISSRPRSRQRTLPRRATTADTFDMKWVYMFGGGLLAGALGMLFAGTFRTRSTEE